MIFAVFAMCRSKIGSITVVLPAALPLTSPHGARADEVIQ